MENITVGLYCFWIGLVSATVVDFFLSLYSKWRKLDSFILVSSQNEIVLSKNHFTTILASIRFFFSLSCSSLIVAGNKQNIILELVIIYLVCLILATFNYFERVEFKVVFEKKARSIWIKSTKYSIDDCEFIVQADRRWFNNEFDSYGLYLVDNQNNHKLIYGYSIYEDISKLEKDIKELLNIS
jgi:hypothetical protein